MWTTEAYTKYFYAWEALGRGHWLWPNEACDLEPPFFAFIPDYFDSLHTSGSDDGRRHTLLSGLIHKLTKKEMKPVVHPGPQIHLLPKREFIERQYRRVKTELQVLLSDELRVHASAFDGFLKAVVPVLPLSFELIACKGKVISQFVCRPQDEAVVVEHLNGFFSGIQMKKEHTFLKDTLSTDLPYAFRDLGLNEEFMRPLNMSEKTNMDSLTGIISVLRSLAHDEVGVIQILTQPTLNAWSREIVRSVDDGNGGSFFDDDPHMPKYAQQKTESPIIAGVIRVSAQSSKKKKAQQIVRRCVQSLVTTTRSNINMLIPLPSDLPKKKVHISSVKKRVSLRPGMLLNVNELSTLVHPTQLVSRLADPESTKPPPISVRRHTYVLGQGGSAESPIEVSLSPEQRVRHIHLIGASGKGKSTLLHRGIVQDIEAGNGLMVLDPHGDLVEDVMRHIPKERHQDVVLIDPSDMDYPVGINILNARNIAEKNVLSSDLISVFKRLSSSWGVNLDMILANTIEAFLESQRGGTLFDMKRFLADEAFRAEFLMTVNDPAIRYYWETDFPMLRKYAASPVLTRLDKFLRNKIIRNMMVQKQGINLRQIVRKGKIILVKLSHGEIGKENSYLLGTLLVSKLNQIMQGQQAVQKEDRKPFYLYIDEFQNFITPSLEDILSGARKYGLGLIMAHQYMLQVEKQSKEIAESMMGNAGTRICFGLSERDANTFAKGFASFDSDDLKSLPIGQAIARVGKASDDFMFQCSLPPEIDAELAEERITSITNLSRAKYASDRKEIEAEYAKIFSTDQASTVPHSAQKESIPNVVPEQEVRMPMSVPQIVTPEIIEEPISTNEEVLQRLAKKENRRLHVQIQKTVKRVAEQYGFKAVMEEARKVGRKVDVGLSRGNLTVAVEVSITTSAPYEVKKVKDLLSVYDHLLFCTSDEKHLRKIKEEVSQAVFSSHRKQLQCILPSQLTAYLDHLSKKKEGPEVKRVRGYKVKVNYKR